MTILRNLLIVLILILPTQQLFSENRNFPDFTQLVEQTAPAVVNISATRTANQNSRRTLLDEFFQRRTPNQQQEAIPQQSSEGSGFIISNDGYVLTNRHVILLADVITVRLNNGREYKAELIGEDSGTDVALLKIDGEALPVLQTGHSEQLKVGEWVLGFGAPFGFDQTVTAGIVSAKRRTLGDEQYVPYIQTDVAINPGNSGGPLLSLNGKVVGINSQILSRTGGYIGISFAIPIELALHVAEQLKEYGKVHRGYLGVQYQDVTYDLAQVFGMEKVEGALLTRVTKDSVAANAGLMKGDIVLKLDNKSIDRAGELPFIVGLIAPGKTVSVEILRNSKNLQLDLKVGERPVPVEEIAEVGQESDNSNLGMLVEDINEEIRKAIESDGIIVSQVLGGPAARAGIRRQDIILSLANQNISSVKQFNELLLRLKKGVSYPVLVLRAAGGYRFMSIRLPK
ncbi:MAG: serine protease Do [Enterobacterales bacterium]